MKIQKTGWKQKHSINFMILVVMGLFANPAFAEDGFVPLFDGETLNDWFTTRSTDSFSVNKEEKAVHVYAGKENGSEQLPGCLVTRKQFSHYILRLEYKWLENRFSPRIDWDRDAGILFHAHGSLKKLWPNSVEMQLGETPGTVTGASEDYWKDRKPRRFHTGDMILIQKGLVQAQNKRKGVWWDPNGELYTGGKSALTRFGTEKPKGEWNEVEIRVLGDKKATFVLNGEIVHEIMNMQKMEGEELVALSNGHIGLQAEWAELLYRNIRIKELDIVDGEEFSSLGAQAFEYENPADYPLMGDWQHDDGKAVTWKRVGDAMQTVSWHNKANKEAGIGGSIRTRSKFGGMRFHMEFRYSVEAEKSGQGRGNSGLFFWPIGEVQILNSYATPNYWDECGAFYKRIPAKVDAAGPPLEWQTYDVEIDLLEKNKAIVTVLLNGRTLHHKVEVKCAAKELSIGLQDHINILQYRNIWLVEK